MQSTMALRMQILTVMFQAIYTIVEYISNLYVLLFKQQFVIEVFSTTQDAISKRINLRLLTSFK